MKMKNGEGERKWNTQYRTEIQGCTQQGKVMRKEQNVRVPQNVRILIFMEWREFVQELPGIAINSCYVKPVQGCVRTKISLQTPQN